MYNKSGSATQKDRKGNDLLLADPKENLKDEGEGAIAIITSGNANLVTKFCFWESYPVSNNVKHYKVIRYMNEWHLGIAMLGP